MSTGLPSLPPSPGAERRRMHWALRWLLRGAAGALVLLGLVMLAASTPLFQEKVRQRVVLLLGDATGGRVELGAFHWSLWRLAVEADNLTIHGLEQPGEVPYAHVDRLYVRAKIINLFASWIGLNLLEVEHPVIHLILYPDGSTNQPVPRRKSSGSRSAVDLIFDLRADQVKVTDGVLLANERSIPFDVAGRDLSARLGYVPGAAGGEKYSGSLGIGDLTLRRGQEAPVRSRLEAGFTLLRNSFRLDSLRFDSGASRLTGRAQLEDWNRLRWRTSLEGQLDLREVEALAEIDGLRGGIADLHLEGHGEGVRAFTVDGPLKLTGGAYSSGNVIVTGAALEAAFHADAGLLRLEDMRITTRQGGRIRGALEIARWLPQQSAGRPAAPLEGHIRVEVAGVSLRSVMETVAPRRYQELGFNAVAAGVAAVDWTGPARDLTASARLAFAPAARAPYDEVPMHGTLNATYGQRGGRVEVRGLDLSTPSSHIRVQGQLGVYPLRQPSQVNADLETTDLSEFNHVLDAMGVSAGGRRGAAALPLELAGRGQFHGVVTSSLLDPDIRGHLELTDFTTLFPAPVRSAPAAGASAAAAAGGPGASGRGGGTRLDWDRLVADAEYSSERLHIERATLSRDDAVVEAQGTLSAHALGRGRYAYDGESGIEAKATVRKAALTDILAVAGEQLPITGTVDLHIEAAGSLSRLRGGGALTILGGEAYREPYKRLDADLRLDGREIQIPRLTLLENGGRVDAQGAYNLAGRALRLDAEGQGFDLSHLEAVRSSGYRLAGLLAFHARARGTLEEPGLTANLEVAHVAIGGEPLGDIHLSAHTEKRHLLYQLNTSLADAALSASGSTALFGGYQTDVHAGFSNLNIGRLLRMAGVDGLSGSSALAGELSVSGPAAEPRQMSGDARLARLEFEVEKVRFESDGPIHARLEDGILRLDPARITGEGTDLRLSGNAGLFGHEDLNVEARGNLNLKLAQLVDPDLISSGSASFEMKAVGTLAKPDLEGSVHFENGAVALGDLPNGLSRINGELRFNQDRLEVTKLSAMTGGGRLELGGYVTYREGIYADLTATGKAIRVRYPPGFSSLADASLRLQGTRANLLLSGSVLISRFAISPGLDLAGFAGAANSIAPIPDPSAPSNHVRLDIRVTSAPQLNFQNSYAKLAGDVDLRVRGTLASPAVLGRISITEGSATFAGTQYQLQRGEIYFSNPVRIDPTIDLDATARVEDYDITIGLHGTIDKLNISYRSEPPLSQADVIALLALGRTQEEQQLYNQEQTSAGINPTTDAILSGALNATVSSRVQKLFGVGSVKIDPAFVGTLGNSMARITVQQQVSRNVQLTYATNVNSTAQQLIEAQIDVTRNVSIVAIRDEAGVFSTVVRIRRRYH